MGQCLFCESTKLTREHVWPDWIVNLFKANNPRRDDLFTVTQLVGGREVRRRKVPTITQRERLVCSDCNSVWMSQLEDYAGRYLKPLLMGQVPDRTSTFTIEAQCAFAAWVSLRSIIFDALHPPPNHTYYTFEERLAFMNTLQPPLNSYLLFGCYGGPAFTAWWNVLNVAGAEGDDFHVTTAVCHRLAFQYVTWRGEPMFDIDGLLAGSWPSVLRRIWPCAPETPCYWPPTGNLGDPLVQKMIDRVNPKRGS